MRKYYLTFVIGSWSDSSHISTRIALSDCCSQLIQIWCQNKNFCFEVSGRIQGWPPPWCFTSMMGCPSYIREGSFHEMVSIRLHGTTIFSFLFNNHAFVHVYDPYPQIALYEWALDQCSIKSPLWLSPFLRKFEWEILVLPRGIAPSMGLCWVPSLNPTLTPLMRNLGYLSLWMSPSDVVLQYRTFLLNSLKSDGMNHVLSKLAL
jgi:hypothetical protein